VGVTRLADLHADAIGKQVTALVEQHLQRLSFAVGVNLPETHEALSTVEFSASDPGKVPSRAGARRRKRGRPMSPAHTHDVHRSSRSGPQLSEARLRELGWERLSLRLRRGVKARLRALAETDGYTLAEWIETWVEMAERGDSRKR
jgi:hypothetical protein